MTKAPAAHMSHDRDGEQCEHLAVFSFEYPKSFFIPHAPLCTSLRLPLETTMPMRLTEYG